MLTPLQLPGYAKASLLLIAFYFLVRILYSTQDILLPLIYGTIFAILLSPLIRILVNRNFNRSLAIALVMVSALLIVSTMVVLLFMQANRLGAAVPQLLVKFQILSTQSVDWASNYFDISPQRINGWISGATEKLIQSSSFGMGEALNRMGNILTTAALTPVYIFMLLFYQRHLMEFVRKLFTKSNNLRVTEFLLETKTIIQNYLSGLAIEFSIIAVLNSAGLLLLGIEYAILLGILGALLNIIPYLGGIIAVLLFMAMALLTKAPIYVLYVMILYSVIQLIDNNYIVPKVVGSKVKLNALVSILAVIAGAALWGIPGMFLFIPLAAMIKLILDRTHSLKPWGFLLGDIRQEEVRTGTGKS